MLYYYITKKQSRPGNVEFHWFPCSKTRFLSQWPENPTVCHDIEMAGCRVVCSMALWGWEALKMSLYPISLLFKSTKNGAAQVSSCTIGGWLGKCWISSVFMLKITFCFTVTRESNHMPWYWNGGVSGGPLYHTVGVGSFENVPIPDFATFVFL